MRVVVVHYHEIALKAGNRGLFIGRLMGNLRRATGGCGVHGIRKQSGRVIVKLRRDADEAAVRARVAEVFGVANFAFATRVTPRLPDLERAVREGLQGRPFASFRITAKRAFKEFPLTSQQVNEHLGTFVRTLTGAKVDLTRPELTVFVEILPAEAYVYFEKVPGPGGLPVGVGGRVVALLSGGIDSPVAAYRVMKRGCPVTFVHFHSHPFLDKTSQEKVDTLVARLTRFQYASRLYVVPFGEIQREVVLGVPPPYRVVVYRRLMARIAEQVAQKEGALALATGESLGQVASQTLENLVVIEAAVGLPILRPLIGMDKDEIAAAARTIGTFETSIIPDQDCCTLFTPKHPVVRSTVEEIRQVEAPLDVPALVAEGLSRAAVREYAFPPASSG